MPVGFSIAAEMDAYVLVRPSTAASLQLADCPAFDTVLVRTAIVVGPAKGRLSSGHQHHPAALAALG